MCSDKVYVGCGNDHKEGYIGCDIRELDHVKIVCKAWELSRHCADLEEIYSRHMLEHLTFRQVELTLTDWYKCLRRNGRLKIIVPNLDFHIDQWNKAIWNEENWSEKFSDTSWGIAGLYGWQRECDPLDANYNETYWDVHKSGFSKNNMRFFLERSGYRSIKIEIVDECHLVAHAKKV